jgi:CHASE3 domain sensor protein
MRNTLSYLAETIALMEEQGLQAAVKMVSTKTGKALMDRMHAILGNMVSLERRLVTEQEKAYNKAIVSLYKIEAVFVCRNRPYSLILLPL